MLMRNKGWGKGTRVYKTRKLRNLEKYGGIGARLEGRW